MFERRKEESLGAQIILPRVRSVRLAAHDGWCLFFFLFRKIKFFRGYIQKDVGRHETMLRDTKMFVRDFFSGI
jgi:hypothetical protein